jgi:lysine 2,3-aminomutase
MEGEICLGETSEPPSSKSYVLSSRKFSHKNTCRREYKPGFIMGAQAQEFKSQFFSDVPAEEWNDWRWQLRNRITSLEQVEKMLSLSEDERVAILGPQGGMPLSITPYYASLLDPKEKDQPLRRCVLPVCGEFSLSQGESEDPLSEDSHSPVPGIVHRYPDRVLFLVTNFCSVYCRYCTRSRMMRENTLYRFTRKRWEAAIEYIASTPAIRDVLLSGGDPLTMSDSEIGWLLTRLRRIPHVEFLRIGTKVPVVLPQRITPTLARLFKQFHPLWMSIHFTHPQEITPEVSLACERLANAGIPLGSQTVLLKGINDNVETMKQLVHRLLKIRVRPYYLYQCDPIPGSQHFRTPVQKGLEIIQGLRGHTTGYGVPHYVIDAPGGGGKIPLVPDYVVGYEGDNIVLRNYEGNIYRYPDPAMSQC